MSAVAVLAPVLRRPERAQQLADSLRAVSPLSTLIFLCSPDDHDEVAACDATGSFVEVVEWPPGRADWARKINHGYEIARALGCEWMLLGSDDIRFHRDWDVEAVAVGRQTGACVVGTNDLHNPTVKRGAHSTHPVVHRDYIECGTIDQAGLVVCESYWHNWVDTELCETAQYRGTWAFAERAHVEHLHPFWAGGEGDDDVYRIGREHYHDDQRMFIERRKLWDQRGAP